MSGLNQTALRCSIIIPTFNRVVFTRICVQALASSIGHRDDVEVIIVDNGSTDTTREFLRELSAPFRVMRNPENQGFARACNRGADASRGDTLIFLNNDTMPLPGWLEPLEAVLEQPDVGIVGSKLLFPDDTIQHAGIAMSDLQTPAHMYYLFPRDYPPSNVQRDYQAVTGACLGVRRSVFLDLGGFDDEYRNSYEDIDLCFRVRGQGFRVVYCPRSILYHFESASEGRHAHEDANRVRFLERWGQAVKVDELEWYKKDGFTTVPRLPARTIHQALSQLAFERRQSTSLARALDHLQAASLAPRGASPSEERAPRLVVPVPNPSAAGLEIVVDGHLAGVTPGTRSEDSTIRYAWERPGTNVAVWEGLAASLDEMRDDHGIDLHLLVPSVPGDYVLRWILADNGPERTIEQQCVTVAPRFGFACRANLPDRFVAGQSERVVVTLRNTGAEALLPHSAFGLSYHWLDETGRRPVLWDSPRVPLPERLAYGEETVVEVPVVPPANAGRYQLVWDMVKEGEFWFSNVGAGVPGVVVEVDALGPNADSPDYPPASTTDSTERLLRELRRRERRIAELESALRAYGDIDPARSERMTISSPVDVELRIRDELIRERDRQIEALRQHIAAIERGRVLRLLNAFGQWRQRLRR